MSSFCQRCGHSVDAHVEGGGPCTWRGSAPFAPCACDVFDGERAPESRPTPIDRERFLADAARAFRICYPERWEELLRAVERGWSGEPREADSSFQQISIDAAREEEPGIQAIEIDVGGPIAAAPAKIRESLRRVDVAIAAKDWPRAFDTLREALNVAGGGEPISYLARVWCASCARVVLEPSPSQSTADYARFWRGRCPACQSTLEFR